MLKGVLNKLLGNRGERRACRFLKRKGYRILAINYANHLGEIDIIALDGQCIVFVEVKTRKSDYGGLPCEAVNHQKQKQITKTALVWLKKNRLLEHKARFDVIGIVWPDGAPPEVTHYINAFAPTGVNSSYT